jgi:hypothetical protein
MPAALRTLGVDALHVRQAQPPSWDPPLRTVVLDASQGMHGRTQGLLECLRELRGGGVVVFALEGPFGRRRTTIRVEGVPTVAALGGATLARRSGAVTLPVIADVSALGRVLARFGAPIALETGREDAAADEAWVRDVAASFDALLSDRAPSRRFERLFETMRFSHGTLRGSPRRERQEVMA